MEKEEEKEKEGRERSIRMEEENLVKEGRKRSKSNSCIRKPFTRNGISHHSFRNT